MKKIILVMIATVGLAFFNLSEAKAQGAELGVRIGNWGTAGVAIDGVLPLGRSNRLHADLVLFDSAIGASGYFDWKFKIADNFTFYPGIGAEAWIGSGVFALSVGAEIGFEYAFDFPVTVGIDWRPNIGIIKTSGFVGSSAGLNIRYRF